MNDDVTRGRLPMIIERDESGNCAWRTKGFLFPFGGHDFPGPYLDDGSGKVGSSDSTPSFCK